jgi:hypothetical protein
MTTNDNITELLAYLTDAERAELDKILRTKPVSEQLGLPIPHPAQAEIMAHPAKYKVVACGRRFGKTLMAAELAIECLFAGRKALLSSPTQDQSDRFWDYCKEWMSEEFQTKRAFKNENRRIIRRGPGEIRVKTGREPDVLRGGDADLIVFDECALLEPEVWYQVGMPMLADRDGYALFLSTPRRRNWFYTLFAKAQSENPDNDPSGRWAWWNASSHANPHLSETVLTDMVGDMHEEDYRQEILAEFLESEGAVFRHIERAAGNEPGLTPITRKAPYPGRFVFGVDWGKMNDYTAVIVMDADRREMVDYDHFRRHDWAVQHARIRFMYEKWLPHLIVSEKNSLGDAPTEALMREGLPVRSFETTPTSKAPLIESLVLAFDRDEIRILNETVIKDEFKSYERKTTLYNRSVYSAPPGLHDDIVMATALSNSGIVTAGGVFFARL